jgi:hypothetical protein
LAGVSPGSAGVPPAVTSCVNAGVLAGWLERRGTAGGTPALPGRMAERCRGRGQYREQPTVIGFLRSTPSSR